MVDLKAFEEFAYEYDKWFDDHALEYELELKAIGKLLPKEGRSVEIGAGTGRFAQPLGISLGVEPSEAMRTIAIGRGVHAIAGTAEAVPVEDGQYDYALLVTTVCFLDSPEIAFREVYRVLGPGGYIIIGLIDRDSRLGRKYEEKKNDSKFYREARFHTVEDMQGDLEKAGFGNIEYMQAILPGDTDEFGKQEVKSGYGEGSFVVLRGQKICA